MRQLIESSATLIAELIFLMEQAELGSEHLQDSHDTINYVFEVSRWELKYSSAMKYAKILQYKALLPIFYKLNV